MADNRADEVAARSPRDNHAQRDQPKKFGHTDLDDCLKNRHFRVEYQPKVALNVQTSQFGVEALCRITDPQLGVVSPDIFIPVAETSGLIAKLTDAVTCEAFHAWRSWKTAGLCLRLALNVSPLLLSDEEWSRGFLQRCSQFAMDPKWITLEITESAAGATGARASEILTRLQKRGFALSIDDFGTGFSSLSTLYRLPIAEMKIDKSFIFDLQEKTGARDLVESAIGMAKRMGIKIVAEGVESESVFEELRRMGCDEVQGYLIGKSMAAEAIVPFFTDWKKSRRGDPSASLGRLPKVVIVQALLNELASDFTATAPTGPYSKHALPIIAADFSRALVRQIPPLVLEGKTIQALGLCHDAIDELQKICPANALSAKLLLLQAQLEEDIATTSDIEIESRQGRFRPLAKNVVTLGRQSALAEVDIPIKCRWFGTGDKSLRIFYESGQYFIEDLGSTGGHLINGARLVRRRPLELSYGRTLVEICLASGAIAPLSLLLQLNLSDPNALVVSFDYDIKTLRADLGEKDWSELKDQLGCTWIIFQDKFNIGRSSECSLVLSDCGAPLAATIAFENGYWVAPAAGVLFKVQNTIIRRRLPILPDSEMEIAGSLLSIRGTAPAASFPTKGASGIYKR